MRTTCRLFLASIFLMAVVGVVSAQDNGAAPPSAAPEPVVTAVPALPPMPGAQSEVPAVEPAPPASADAPPVVQPEPAAAQIAPVPEAPVAPALNPPAPEKLPVSVATAKSVQKKKTVKKAIEKPANPEADAALAAGAAVSAATDTTGNTPPPPGALAGTAPAVRVAAPPAAEAPAAEKSKEATSKREMGVGGWTLAALAVVALFAGITLLRRRRARNETSIMGPGAFSLEPQPALLSQELKPSLVPRP